MTNEEWDKKLAKVRELTKEQELRQAKDAIDALIAEWDPAVRTITEPETFTIKLPESCKVSVTRNIEDPTAWVIECRICSLDVETGEIAEFKTTQPWGTEPTMTEVANTVKVMLNHEVREQLGLDPHNKTKKML